MFFKSHQCSEHGQTDRKDFIDGVFFSVLFCEFQVMEKPCDKEQCIELLYDLLSKRYAGQSGIIYAFSIADTEEIASALMQRGINLRPYHADLTNDRRTKIHSKWLSGEIQAVVATVAFGM